MFIEYLPNQSFIHSLDVRTKLLGFTGLSCLLFMFNNPLYILAVSTCVIIQAYSAGLPGRKIRGLLAPLLPVYVLIVLFSGFSPPDRFLLPVNRTVLVYLLPHQELGLTIGGLLMGFSLLLRLITMVIASSLVTVTTPIDDFIQLFDKLKLPSEFSFVVTTALRFIPTMDRKRQFIIDAQKSRGAKLAQKGLSGHIRNSIPIMVPLMTGSIMMANNLSKAMLNRGYGCSQHRTPLKQIFFKQRDYFCCFLVAVAVTVGIYIRFGLHRGML